MLPSWKNFCGPLCWLYFSKLLVPVYFNENEERVNFVSFQLAKYSLVLPVCTSLFLLIVNITFQSGFIAAVPYLVMWMSVIGSGLLADHLRENSIMTTTQVRKAANGIGMYWPFYNKVLNNNTFLSFASGLNGRIVILCGTRKTSVRCWEFSIWGLLFLTEILTCCCTSIVNVLFYFCLFRSFGRSCDFPGCCRLCWLQQSCCG